MNGSASLSQRLLDGTRPGLVDDAQPSRLLRYAESVLSFADFNPLTASPSVVPDLNKLSIHDYRSKRIVIETFPTGSSWRFIPKARRDEGVLNEGLFPRTVEICGERYTVSQEQWDIYKLDPLYDCYVRESPKLSVISRIGPKTQTPMRSNGANGKHRLSPSLEKQGLPPKKKVQLFEDVQIFEVSSDEADADMSVDEGSTSLVAGHKKRVRMDRGQKRQERREKTVRRTEKLARGDEDAQLYSKRKVHSRDSSERESTDYFRDAVNYVPSHGGKRTRTTSPSSTRRELEIKRLEREKQRKTRRQTELMSRQQQRNDAFMNQVFADVPVNYRSSDPQSPDFTEEQLAEEEDAERREAIFASIKRMAELEADRPLWEDEAKKRAQREWEEEQARIEARERKQAEAEEAARQAKTQRLAEEMQQREEEARRQQEAMRQREKRQRQQRQWGFGPWTTQRAFERYKSLSETFDNRKFSISDPLAFDDVPWPTLQPPTNISVEDVDWTAVEKFFSAVRPLMRAQDYRTFVEKAHKRMHPDRWRSRGLLKSVLDEEERNCLEVAANTVAQAITPLWREITGR